MNYYNEIKKELIDNELNKKVKDYSKNKYEIQKYYNVGKLLLEAGNEYGESVIKEYSLRLTEELGSGYSQRNLRNMRQFYKVSKKWQTLSAKLSWSHYCEILWFDDNKFQYYVKISELNGLSIRQLRERIKSNEYERLPESTKNKSVEQKESDIVDFIKNPILIKNSNKYDIFSEKVLQKLILEDIEKTMLSLLEPEIKEVELGKAEVRQVFTVGKTTRIAGCYVTEGKIVRSKDAVLYRDGKEIFRGAIDQLKRFKDDVKEVAQGFECGISFAKWNDIEIGDIIEVSTTEEVERKSL